VTGPASWNSAKPWRAPAAAFPLQDGWKQDHDPLLRGHIQPDGVTLLQPAKARSGKGTPVPGKIMLKQGNKSNST
jgi:hypothetical protein